MLNKILKVLFVTLLIILVVEVVYLFFLQKQKIIKNDFKSSSITILITPTISSSQTPTSADQSFSEDSLQSLVNWLRKGKKDLVVASSLTQTYQGKIVEIKIEEGINPLNKFAYAMSLKIEGKGGNKKGFLFSKDTLTNKMNVLALVEERKQSFKIEDLSVGDEVTVKEDQNLFIMNCSKDECYQKFEITKL